MGSSFKLFSVRGIDIRLHITFPLILLWAAFQYGLGSGNLEGAIFGVIAILMLFILVTLHELGHSFTAQYFGVPVNRIVLSPLGGVAQLSQIPDKPIQELVIAIAGPAVNMVVALVMGALVWGFGLQMANPFQVLSAEPALTFMALFTYIFVYNIFLAVFNLIPAFPLDGGRIFRSLLALRFDYLKATNFAVNTGRVLAVVMGIYGLINGGLFLVFISVFIYASGSQEAQFVRARTFLRGMKVKDVFSDSVYRLNTMSTVQQANNLMVFGRQRYFPVVDGDQLVGFLTYPDLVQATRTAAPHSLITGMMRRDIIPVSYEADLFEAQKQMSEQRLEALPVVLGSRFMGIINLRQIIDRYRIGAMNPRVAPQGQSI